MDAALFLQLIQGTPLLTDAQKSQYAREASAYTPEQRAEIATVIHEEEEQFLATVAVREQAAMQDARIAMQHRMADLRAQEAAARQKDAENILSLTEEINQMV